MNAMEWALVFLVAVAVALKLYEFSRPDDADASPDNRTGGL